MNHHELMGFDISAEAVERSMANAAAAGVKLTLSVADAAHLPVERHSIDAIVTNPPWGKQVEAHHPTKILHQFVLEADRLLNATGCLVVLHDWGDAFAENIRRKSFEVCHEQNLRTAGRIARLTFAFRKHKSPRSPALDLQRLASARSRFPSTADADFIL